MKFFSQGTYSGHLDKSVCDEYIFACVTSYAADVSHEQMHCHENAHISFVLNGGSLEKRRSTEIERLPGKITFYQPGECHRSTNIVNYSKHINLEIANN